MRIQRARVTLQSPDPQTGLPYSWTLTQDDGRRLSWRGVYTGPLTLADDAIDAFCRMLLGFGQSRMI